MGMVKRQHDDFNVSAKIWGGINCKHFLIISIVLWFVSWDNMGALERRTPFWTTMDLNQCVVFTPPLLSVLELLLVTIVRLRKRGLVCMGRIECLWTWSGCD